MAAKLFVSPTNAKTSAAGIVNFRAAGGTRTGYTWSITDNQSGGSIVAGTGVYTAGALLGVEDTVQVIDSGGATTTQIVRVIDGPTLAQLREAAQSAADMIGSNFVTDVEWSSWINGAAKELYGILVQKYGDDYFVQLPPYEFTTDGTSDYYPLPADFFKLLGVDLVLSSSPGDCISLYPYNLSDRNRNAFQNVQGESGRRTNLRYRVMGNRIAFSPRAAAGQKIRLLYIPKVTDLVLDTDVLDGVCGWEDYVVTDAAIKALAKEESDTTVKEREKAGIVARIESEAANRDVGHPQTVSDTAYGESDYGIDY
jgi:hypothetical protein